MHFFLTKTELSQHMQGYKTVNIIWFTDVSTKLQKTSGKPLRANASLVPHKLFRGVYVFLQ